MQLDTISLICAFFITLHSLNSQTVNYTPTTEDFTNPDRGFYHFTQTSASNYTPLDFVDLVSRRTTPYTPYQANYQVKSSLVFRYYVLDDFVDANTIPSTFLNLVEADFNIARQAGVKLIMRFAYTVTVDSSCGQEFCSPYGDAPKARMLQHIQDLKPLFQNHDDVISAVQMGFIGIWGEQYYTDYFGDASVQGKLFNSDWLNRNEILAALLDAVPQNRMVHVRYPQLKQRFLFGPNAPVTTNPMTASQAHSTTDISRIGFHNDCFLASANDFGTYFDYGNDSSSASDQTTVLKAYSEADGQFVGVGGETCSDGFSPENDCSGQAVSDMNSLHFNYLNAWFNNDVNNDWVTGGCMDEIKRKLGYRIEMINGNYPTIVTQNSPFSFVLNLENIGFSAPINEREIKLVLREVNTNIEYTIPFAGAMSDVRKWYTGLIALQESMTISSSIPPGNYDLFLHILEPANNYTVANRPEYAIRLANTGTWESTTGFNDLQHTITVLSDNSNCVEIDGDFSDWTTIPTISTNGSNGLIEIKAADDASYLYAFIAGNIDVNFQFFIDSDNDLIGSNEFTNTYWSNTGINYLVENGNMYRYTGSGLNWSWNFVGSTTFVKNALGLEIRIDKSLIAGLSNVYNLGFASLDNTFTEVGHIPNINTAAAYNLSSAVVDCTCSTNPLNLTGSLFSDAHYQTDGVIETSQLISNNSAVEYDSKISIELKSGFETIANVTMHAYIDGCN